MIKTASEKYRITSVSIRHSFLLYNLDLRLHSCSNPPWHTWILHPLTRMYCVPRIERSQSKWTFAE